MHPTIAAPVRGATQPADFGSLEQDLSLVGVAMGLDHYSARERRWDRFIVRDARLRGVRGFAFQTSYPNKMRIALPLDSMGGRGVCRAHPKHVHTDGHARRPVSFLPAEMDIWGCSNEGGDFHTAMLAFDREGIEHKLRDNVDLQKLEEPRLNCTHERIYYLMRCLVEECGRVDGLSSLYCESLIVMILVELMRGSSAKPIKRGGLTPTQLSRVLDCMEANLQRRVGLSELAALAGVSVSHFCHAFKQSTGVAPHQWQLDAKIRRAQQLLSQGDKSLAEIALDVGFVDRSHFTRTFHRNVGVAPTAWLRERRS